MILSINLKIIFNIKKGMNSMTLYEASEYLNIDINTLVKLNIINFNEWKGFIHFYTKNGYISLKRSEIYHNLFLFSIGFSLETNGINIIDEENLIFFLNNDITKLKDFKSDYLILCSNDIEALSWNIYTICTKKYFINFNTIDEDLPDIIILKRDGLFLSFPNNSNYINIPFRICCSEHKNRLISKLKNKNIKIIHEDFGNNFWKDYIYIIFDDQEFNHIILKYKEDNEFYIYKYLNIIDII